MTIGTQMVNSKQDNRKHGEALAGAAKGPPKDADFYATTTTTTTTITVKGIFKLKYMDEVKYQYSFISFKSES